MAKTVTYLWLVRQSIMCLHGSFFSTQGAGQREMKLQEGAGLNEQQGSIQPEAQKVMCLCLGMGDTMSAVLCCS